MAGKNESRKNDEAWEKYITRQGLKLDGRRHEVSADDLKAVTGREPRLLAKFDTLEKMPAIFKDNGYAILPTANGQYLLFRGSIFQELAPCTDHEQIKPQLPFPLETAGRGIGEMQYVDHAFNTGMLSAFAGTSPLYLTIRGRERSGAFDFTVGRERIHASGVQIEVDGGYEGQRDIILVEAKIGDPNQKREPMYFNIRQLFYPYRRFAQLVPSKQIRPLFFAYDIATDTYSFYEFAFSDPNELNSLVLVQSKSFTLYPVTKLRIDALQDARFEVPDVVKRLAPQADDLNKITQLLIAVEEGYTSSDELASYFNYVERQSHYYPEAAEYLGLVTRNKSVVMLTNRGIEFLQAPIDKKSEYLAKLIVNSWIFKELNNQAHRTGSFSSSDIEHVLAETRNDRGQPRYSGTTIPRRRGTIIAWLRWLADSIGCYEEDRPNGAFKLK